MHYHRYRDIYAKGVIVTPRMGVGGEFRCILRNAEDLRPIYDSGWFHNLITDKGLDAIVGNVSDYQWTQVLSIGSGTNTPSTSDTSLQTGLASRQYALAYGNQYTYYGWGASPPWEASADYYRFDAGVGTGTIREVGTSAWSNYVQAGNNGNGNLTSRHLTPAPIVKGATHVLDVWYKAYWYFDTADATGTISLDGQTYNYTIRWGDLTSGNKQGSSNGFTKFNINAASSTGRQYSNGELAAVTATALTDGEISQNYTSAAIRAVPGSPNHYRDQRFTVLIDGELTSQTLRTTWMHWTTGIATQARLGRAGGGDEPVPKTADDIFYIDHRFHVDRYTP